VDDYPMSIKELVKKLQKLVKKQDVLAGLVALIAANNA